MFVSVSLDSNSIQNKSVVLLRFQCHRQTKVPLFLLDGVIAEAQEESRLSFVFSRGYKVLNPGTRLLFGLCISRLVISERATSFCLLCPSPFERITPSFEGIPHIRSFQIVLLYVSNLFILLGFYYHLPHPIHL